MLLKNFFNNKDRTSVVKREIIFSFLVKIIGVAVTLLMVPLLLDFLDKERYGVWLTLSSLFTWFSFFDIGIGNGMRNKLVEAFAKNDEQLAKEYVSTTYAIIASIFVLIILFFQIINPYIDWQSILNVKIISPSELYLLTAVVFGLFLLRFIFQLIGIIYIAKQKPSINNVIITFGNLLSFLIILIIYKFYTKGDLLLLGGVLTGIPLLVLVLANFIAFNGEFKFLRPSIKSVKIIHAKGLLTLGLQFFVVQIAAILLSSSANIIISHLFGSSEVVTYTTALMYYQLPIMVYGIIMTPIWSAVTDAYVKKDYDWLKLTLKKLNRLSILISFGVVLMTLVSPFIYKIWLGNRIDIPYILSITMGIFAIINIFLAPYTSFINGLGKMRLSTFLVVISFLIYIPLAIFISKWLNSSAGLVIATCIINLFALYFEPLQVKKILNNSAKGMWLK